MKITCLKTFYFLYTTNRYRGEGSGWNGLKKDDVIYVQPFMEYQQQQQQQEVYYPGDKWVRTKHQTILTAIIWERAFAPQPPTRFMFLFS